MPERQFPDEITIEVLADGKGLPGLLVLTRIVMRELHDYWGIFGPTNAEGQVTITRDQLIDDANNTRSFFETEYAPAATSFGGLIEVRVLDEPGVMRALDAAAELPEFPYSAGHLERLMKALEHLVFTGRILMEVGVTSVGGDAEVRAEPPL